MPNALDFYGSEYFKSSDIVNGPLMVKIESCGPDTVTNLEGKTTTRLIVAFAGLRKKLVVNATNASVLALAFGPDYSTWAGKEIELFVVDTTFAGSATKGIRVRVDIPF